MHKVSTSLQPAGASFFIPRCGGGETDGGGGQGGARQTRSQGGLAGVDRKRNYDVSYRANQKQWG